MKKSFIIIASDGVWEVLDNEKACRIVDEILVGGHGPQAAAVALCEAAMAKGSEDNIAAVSNPTEGGALTSVTLVVIAIVAIIAVVVVVGVVAMLIVKKQPLSNMHTGTNPVYERAANPSFEMAVLQQQKLGNETPTAVSLDEANGGDVYVNVKCMGNT